MNNIEVKDIDSFIAGYPKATQKLMQQIRETIRKAAPDASETISYGIPTFTLYGNLVHFSAYQHHIGFYPGAGGIAEFKNEISKYKSAKGSVQFPLDQPLPLDLVTRIVKFRVEQNLAKAIATKKLRTCPNGHQYYKSSDCPTCPVCEKNRKPESEMLSLLSAPARRALANHKIATPEDLSKYKESEILALHGMGPGSIPKLRKVLSDKGLSFKK